MKMVIIPVMMNEIESILLKTISRISTVEHAIDSTNIQCFLGFLFILPKYSFTTFFRYFNIVLFSLKSNISATFHYFEEKL